MSAIPGYMEKVGWPSDSVSCGYGPEVKHLVLVLDDFMNTSVQCKAALHQRDAGFSTVLKRGKTA